MFLNLTYPHQQILWDFPFVDCCNSEYEPLCFFRFSLSEQPPRRLRNPPEMLWPVGKCIFGVSLFCMMYTVIVTLYAAVWPVRNDQEVGHCSNAALWQKESTHTICTRKQRPAPLLWHTAPFSSHGSHRRGRPWHTAQKLQTPDSDRRLRIFWRPRSTR